MATVTLSRKPTALEKVWLMKCLRTDGPVRFRVGATSGVDCADRVLASLMYGPVRSVDTDPSSAAEQMHARFSSWPRSEPWDPYA